MKYLITQNSTMTLKEITDLLDVEHNKAMKIVTSMAAGPEFGTVDKLATVYNDKGQTIETYQLDRRQSIAVAARLNTTLLMRVIDRLEELENQAQILQFEPFRKINNAKPPKKLLTERKPTKYRGKATAEERAETKRKLSEITTAMGALSLYSNAQTVIDLTPYKRIVNGTSQADITQAICCAKLEVAGYDADEYLTLDLAPLSEENYNYIASRVNLVSVKSLH